MNTAATGRELTSSEHRDRDDGTRDADERTAGSEARRSIERGS